MICESCSKLAHVKLQHKCSNCPRLCNIKIQTICDYCSTINKKCSICGKPMAIKNAVDAMHSFFPNNSRCRNCGK